MLGKIWAEKHVLSLSYQWMDYNYTASVNKDTFPNLYLNEKFYGSGAGLGYYYAFNENAMLGATVDNIEIHWRNRIDDKVVFGIRSSLGF